MYFRLIECKLYATYTYSHPRTHTGVQMSNRFNGFRIFAWVLLYFVLHRCHRCRRYRGDCHRRLISTFSIVDFAVPTRGVFGDFSFFSLCFSFAVLLKSVFVIIGIQTEIHIWLFHRLLYHRSIAHSLSYCLKSITSASRLDRQHT